MQMHETTLFVPRWPKILQSPIWPILSASGANSVLINETGIVDVSEPAQIQQTQPVFDNVPILQAAGAALQVQVAQKKILDKEYFPVFHFLTGFNVRGAGLSNLNGRPTSAQGSGTLPAVPNYQAALIINWNFLDIYRIRAQKKSSD